MFKKNRDRLTNYQPSRKATTFLSDGSSPDTLK